MKAAVLALGVGLVTGCRRPPPVDETAPQPAPTETTPVDHTLPHELAEGTEVAFGLRVPRYMKVTARFQGAVFFEGPSSLEAVSNYVRQRVTSGKVETGPSKTVFSDIEAKGSHGKPLWIEVSARGTGSRLYVRDETKPSADDGLSPDQRLRAVGLHPDGTPLDPTHLE